MQKQDSAAIVTQTKKWITDVVIGCNFCPFAAKEVKRKSIQYEVLFEASSKSVLEAVSLIFKGLDADENIETSFLILPFTFINFEGYLKLLEQAEDLLDKENYAGIYQLASFHPHYLFAGSTETDAANYTNRSPYPMLHFLREESLSKAIDNHSDAGEIPKNNIAYANAKGLAFMQRLANL
jgi:uncharacterized protein